LVEQRTENPRVDGSIPSLATIFRSQIHDKVADRLRAANENVAIGRTVEWLRSVGRDATARERDQRTDVGIADYCERFFHVCHEAGWPTEIDIRFSWQAASKSSLTLSREAGLL
jgi:hypothetical protein